MLSPTPLSLLCALLLCLPLAIVYTIISATITTTYTDENPETINLPRLNNTKNHQEIPFEPNTALPDDDESLFQVASRVNPIPCPQKCQPKKLAFMFLTNIPLPFAPLWELYFNNQRCNTKTLFNIYIHADPTYNYDPPFSGVFAHRVIPSKHTRRFTPTLISAARRLLAHALLDDPANAMFALISPSCIPIHSFDFTYKTVINSDKSFIEILNNKVGAYDRWGGRNAPGGEVGGISDWFAVLDLNT